MGLLYEAKIMSNNDSYTQEILSFPLNCYSAELKNTSSLPASLSQPAPVLF